MLGWPAAFALTVLVEAPVYLALLRRAFGAPGALALALLVNAATHPVVWFVIPHTRPWWRGFAAAELFAWLAEAAVLALAARATAARRPGRAFGALDALLAALVANALSAGLGLLLFA